MSQPPTGTTTDHGEICGWIDAPHPTAGVELVGPDGRGRDRVGYPGLAARVRALAAVLRARGLGRGDNACLVLPNDIDTVAVLVAVWRCGASVTMIAPPGFAGGADHPGHVRGIVEQAVPHLVVAGTRAAAALAPALPGTDVVTVDELLEAEVGTTGVDPAERPDGHELAVVQFTSGSTGSPRGVRVTWENLAANVRRIERAVDTRPADVVASWLPLYHDMGLVGGLVCGLSRQMTVRLFRPDDFVRDPAAWIHAMDGAAFSVGPSFGLGLVADRTRPEDVAGVDLSAMRALVLGAEPIDVAHLEGFCRVAVPLGFPVPVLRPGYGMAEATLVASMSGIDSSSPLTAVRLTGGPLRPGEPVGVAETRPYDGSPLEGHGWSVALGTGRDVDGGLAVVDEEGRDLPEGALGEIVVTGASVAAGYTARGGDDPAPAVDFGGRLRTGDGGVLIDGQVHVFGRMGSSLKVRGAAVFMEDLDARIAAGTGLGRHRLASIVRADGPRPGVTVVVERTEGPWRDDVLRVAHTVLGRDTDVDVVAGAAGTILRTSSGKPRRQAMWRALAGSTATPTITGRRDSLAAHTDAEITTLLTATLRRVRVPEDASIVLEGSIAEGFGNEGSDIDFLAIVPGDEETPVMPAVLFVDGRRVEVRTRSEREIRAQLAEALAVLRVDDDEVLTTDQDVLNRCQRFLRAAVVRRAGVDVDALRAGLPPETFGGLMARWWRARARQSLWQAALLGELGAEEESAGWARDGLLQGVKAWAALRGETYIEAKWTGPQLDRIGDTAVRDRYEAIQHRFDLLEAGTGEPGSADLARVDAVALLGELGVDVPADASDLVVSRVPGVTSWPIDGRIHVLRDQRDVLVLSESAGRAWRSTVFGRTPAQLVASARGDIRGPLAEFLRLGLVAVTPRGGGPLRPAVAMVTPLDPPSAPPSHISPVLGVSGGMAVPGRDVTRLPLDAVRFTECGSAIVWSNVIVENAREDLLGALADEQYAVADAAAHRMVSGCVRMLLGALGCAPLPPDVGPVSTLRRVVPEALEGREEVIAAVADARAVRFRPSPHGDGAPGDRDALLARLDVTVATVRGVAGLVFPDSFRDRDQWRETLSISYDWLRVGAYLDARLPIDEVRDLLSSGGAQPHVDDTADQEA